MNRFSKWIPLGVGAVALGVVLISVACGTTASSPKDTQMRVVEVSPTAPTLDLLIDNKSVLPSIAYGMPTAFTNITAVSHDLKLFDPVAQTDLLDNPKEPFSAGTSYTYLIIGDIHSATGIRGNKLTDDHTVADKGMFKLRVVNGSPNSGSVDVYIVTPATKFDGATPVKPNIAGLASSTASAYQVLASGSYHVYVTRGGDQTCLIPPTPSPFLPSCLINLDGRNGTAVPAFQDKQNRTLIMLNQIPGGGTYTTLPLLADLN